jgi:hypothetical protein
MYNAKMANPSPFPFKRNYMRPVDLFQQLREYKPNVIYDDSYKVVTRFAHTFKGNTTAFSYVNEPFDQIGDYFTEEQRLTAKRKDTLLSPLEQWNDPVFRKQVILSAKTRQMSCIRDEIYRRTKEATQFKPSLVVGMIHLLFGAQVQTLRMMDISSGWGDRAIGAMAVGIASYVGFDPNTTLQPGYNKLIKVLSKQSTTKVSIHPYPFESQETGRILDLEEPFDLMMTSPPYFDFEIYTEQNTQSCTKFPKFDDWFKSFLMFSLLRSIAHLKINGYLVIHISDMYQQKICDNMNERLQSLGIVKYIGVVSSFGAANKPRPMWVWQRQ